MPIKQYLQLFRIRNLIFLILSGTISQFGDRLTHMLLITLIGVSAPGKVSAFSAASLTFTLPVIILSPLVGILVDHWSKRSVMIVCHVVQAVILILTPFLIYFTHSFLPFWIVVTLFFSIDIFNNTAKPALLPRLVAYRKLLSANSLDQFLSRFATVAGMVIGGFLIAKIGWQWGFVFNASTHLCAGLLIFGIAKTADIKPAFKSTDDQTALNLGSAFKVLIADAHEVITLMKTNLIVTIVLSSFAVMTFIASVSYTILIFLVQQILNWGTSGVGIMSGILAVGMILGALFVGIIKFRFNKLFLIIAGFLIYGLLFTIGPFFISRLFIIIVAVVGGIIFSLIIVAQNTILQEQVNAQIRGRIFGIKEFFGNITFLITAIITGVISDLTSYKIVLLAVGVLLIIFALFIFVINRRPTQRLTTT